jgi:cation diffusion facilitator family transporter
MGLNLIPTFTKLFVGYLTQSLSLIADGFDSVFDAATNVVGLVGIWVAAKPADKQYPYGHRKAETITALVISYLLFLTCYELIRSAFERIFNPALISAEANFWSFAALGVSIAIHMYVVHYELNAGRKLHSDVLVADALHTRADIFISVAVGGGMVFILLGIPLADPILALVVALMIARIGIDIIRESTPTLMDKVVLPTDKVEQIVLSVPGIRSVHHVRSRGHEQAVYADLHIRVDPGMSTERAHAIAHEVGRRLREFDTDLQDVTIHVEPADNPSPIVSQETIAIPLRRIAIGLGASIHDIWAREVNGDYFVESHLEADGALPLRQAHELSSKLEERARAEIPHLRELTTHIEPVGKLIENDEKELAAEKFSRLVEQVVKEVDTTANCHEVHIHEIEGRLVVTLHINLPGEMPLAEAHRVAAKLETQLRETVPKLDRVIIHTEPR